MLSTASSSVSLPRETANTIGERLTFWTLMSMLKVVFLFLSCDVGSGRKCLFQITYWNDQLCKHYLLGKGWIQNFPWRKYRTILVLNKLTCHKRNSKTFSKERKKLGKKQGAAYVYVLKNWFMTTLSLGEHTFLIQFKKHFPESIYVSFL